MQLTSRLSSSFAQSHLNCLLVACVAGFLCSSTWAIPTAIPEDFIPTSVQAPNNSPVRRMVGPPIVPPPPPPASSPQPSPTEAPPKIPSVDDLKGKKSFTPAKDACVFYTMRLKDVAQEYAKTNKKTTIWDVWPASFYDHDQEPLKNFKTDEQRRSYFQNMSRAYAQICSGAAWVAIYKGKDPCSDSIWVTDEYDAISKGETGITGVTRLDEDGKEDGKYSPPKKTKRDAAPMVGPPIVPTKVDPCKDSKRFTGTDAENYLGN